MQFLYKPCIYISKIKSKGDLNMNENLFLDLLKEESNECEDYIVSWEDKEGNEFYNEWMDFASARELFYKISGSDENKVDPSQVSCELWSDPDNKVLMKYDNIENKYYNY